MQVVSEYLMNCLAEPLTSWFPVLCTSWMICPFLKESESVSHFSHFWLFATAWTVAHQASLSMGFSRQEYWSGLPFPSPGDLPDPGMESESPALQVDSLPSEPLGKPKNTGGVAYPFSRVSSWPRNWTRVSCIADSLPAEQLHYTSLFSVQ